MFFISACTCLRASCCAKTAPTPNNNVPTTTTVRIICRISLIYSNRAINPHQADCRCPHCNPTCGGSFPQAMKISETMQALMLPDRDPHPFRGCRHIDVVDFVFPPQPVDDGVHDSGTGADRTRLARALDAQRVGL